MSQKFGCKEVSKTFPREPPYKIINEYFDSKLFLNSAPIQTVQLDKPGHDPVYHLLAAQRVLQKKTSELENKRNWAKGEYDKLEVQWSDLYEQETKFNQTFKKLDTFVRSNQLKRERAKILIEENIKLIEKWTEEFNSLQEKMDEFRKMNYTMEKQIANMRLYEKYLNNVVDNSEFLNAEDILTRYEALFITKSELAERQKKDFEELQIAKLKITKMAEDNRLKILGLENMTRGLNARYNTVFRRTLRWENVVLAIKKKSYERYKELTEVKKSCWNIYLMMARRRKDTPQISENDYENQLTYIKDTLRELKIVDKMMKYVDFGQSSPREIQEQIKREKLQFS